MHDTLDQSLLYPGPIGRVFNIMRFSLHDGPGIRTTVFLKGCPLQCSWCHNPESQSAAPEVMYASGRCVHCGDCVEHCPHGALSWRGRPVREAGKCRSCGTCVDACPSGARHLAGQSMSVNQLVDVIRRDAVFFEESGGGVTFSGGEPFMQPEFLKAIIAACKQHGMHVAVDTCGFVPTGTLLDTGDAVDLFLYDIKAVNDSRHRQITGVSNQLILANLECLVQHGAAIILRMPVIPGLNDDPENIDHALCLMSKLKLRKLDLLPYHEIGTDKYSRLGRNYELAGLASPSAARMEQIAGRFMQEGFEVRIGG